MSAAEPASRMCTFRNPFWKHAIPPTFLVSPLVRRPDRAHPFRREVGELFEEIVVDGTPAHHPYQPTYGVRFAEGLF